MKIRNFFSAILALSVFLSTAWAANVAPSQSAPGGLATNKVPQFVTIGFDDNSNAEGMQWILDFLRTKTNQTGLGNSKTYDGSPARVSFYTNTRSAFDSIQESPSLVTQLTKAVTDGHEMGNHTATHLHGREFTAAEWADEISKCTNDLLSAGIISSKSDIKGFRTPFLEYGDLLFQGLKDSGIVYDCSIEEGSQSDQDGSNFLWPYTLDNGSPGHDASWLHNAGNPDAFDVNGVPGLWELANHNVIIPPDAECAAYGVSQGFRDTVAYRLTGGKTSGGWHDGIIANGKMTGFDYNMWAAFIPSPNPDSSFQAAMTKAQFLAVLKYTLDLRLNGNRAPFMFGAHSQYYTSANNSSYPNATEIERQEAIEEFIEYALGKSEVRIVPAYKIIEWMEDPIALDDISGTKYTLTVNSGTGDGDWAEGADVAINADAAPDGKVFDAWTGDISGVANVNASSTTITIGTANITITATYKDATGPDTLNPSINFTTYDASNEGWQVGAIDDLGSTGSVSKPSDAVVKAEFNYAEYDSTKGDDGYAYGSISYYDTTNYNDVNYIKVTYKSSEALNIVLEQETFPAGGAHQKVLAKSDNFTTVLIEVNATNFTQPDWADPKGDLDMSKMNGVSFEPVVPDAGGAITFEISELVFYGYNDGTPITSISNKSVSQMAINYVTSRSMNISIPENGKYSLSLYSLDGKLITKIADKNFSKGAVNVSWNGSNISSQMYLISLKGAGTQSVRKAFIK